MADEDGPTEIELAEKEVVELKQILAEVPKASMDIATASSNLVSDVLSKQDTDYFVNVGDDGSANRYLTAVPKEYESTVSDTMDGEKKQSEGDSCCVIV